jgi:serine protease
LAEGVFYSGPQDMKTFVKILPPLNLASTISFFRCYLCIKFYPNTLKMSTGLRTLPLYLLFLILPALSAQHLPHTAGEVLVALAPGTSPQPCITALYQQFHVHATFEHISRSLNVYLIHFDAEMADETLVADFLRLQNGVSAVQLNLLLNTRQDNPAQEIVPNDPLFSQQWQYINYGAGGAVPNADLDADAAWEYTTGGITPAGDTVVIAVIDGGLAYQHTDLQQNLWRNYQETPNDFIDNDGNGYVDDFLGWNVVTGNDNILPSSGMHGTPVSGIIGARGNNDKGVTGVNWNTRVLFVAGNETVAHILKAFDYVYFTRRRYNESDGAEGAFIVALNCSWGINFGQPADAPLWCAALDTLGSVGVITVAATANLGINVDVSGDLPSTCPSDFLLAVTSLNNLDLKPATAAWGPQHVDLAAYGHGILTLGNSNSYGTFSGTSFAAPHVSGAIGLLYASECPELIALSKVNPAAGALKAREWVLSTTTPNLGLSDLVNTGGRLNLGALISSATDACPACNPPFAITDDLLEGISLRVAWVNPGNIQNNHFRIRKAGAQQPWTVYESVNSPFLPPNLDNCTWYEYQILGLCSDGVLTESPVFQALTGHCCHPPATFTIVSEQPGSVTVKWAPVAGANAYRIKYWWSGNTPPTQIVVPENVWTNTSAPDCTEVFFQIAANCPAVSADWIFSDTFSYRTFGCGACVDYDYCPAAGSIALAEWIAGITLNGQVLSENEGPGYGFQSWVGQQDLIPELIPGGIYPMSITAGSAGPLEKYFFRVYLDLNQDGSFQPSELVLDPGFATEGPVNQSIQIPEWIEPGVTRMRVMLKYKTASNTAPGPCELFDFGQVEDFCVKMTELVPATDPVVAAHSLKIFPQPGTDQVQALLPAPGGIYRVYDLNGALLLEEKATAGTVNIVIKNWITGVYVFKYSIDNQHYSQRILKM